MFPTYLQLSEFSELIMLILFKVEEVEGYFFVEYVRDS